MTILKMSIHLINFFCGDAEEELENAARFQSHRNRLNSKEHSILCPIVRLSKKILINILLNICV